MKHIVSFSGGRTSAYLVHLMEQKRKNEGWDVEYVFMDTGAEHPKTYEFIKKCVDYFGIELTVLKTVINQEMGIGPTFKVCTLDSIGWDLSVFKEMTKKYGNPYIPGGNFCTDKLKTVTFNKYIKSKGLRDGGFKTWLGIRYDEPRRIKEKKNIKYLAEISTMEKMDIVGWWDQQDFDLDIDEHLGNCVFCIHKAPTKIALAQRDEPDLAVEWNKMIHNSRRLKESIPINVVYQNHQSMESIAGTFKDHSDNEIRAMLRSGKRYAVGSCSESCEVFGGQIDMFEGAA
jgi:hypothetical protein